jgi:hypothetical protein
MPPSSHVGSIRRRPGAPDSAEWTRSLAAKFSAAGAGGDYSGILIPYFLPGSDQLRDYRLRRDHPDVEYDAAGSLKAKRKYLSAPGRSNMVYLPPGVRQSHLCDPMLPVVITEGEFKTLALWRAADHGAASLPRFLPLGVSGIYNWRGTKGKTVGPDGSRMDVKGAIPDLDADCPDTGIGRENPLLRSGLAFSGANHRGEAGREQEDGVLTAEEAASLDLQAAEWVVLSGCDTGVGDVRAGEGVLGLRRAFLEAGARTLIASLWPVGDDDARQWMTSLYRARFVSRRSTVEAIRDADVQQLRSRRAGGKSTHPFYWAGFVAVGDWR